MRGLCNINVWREKRGRFPWKDSISPLSCMSRIFRPECSFGSREIKNPCIQAPDFSPLFPGARGNRNGFCRFVKSFTTNRKHGYHPLQHEPAFPDDKSRVDAGFSCDLALPPDSERPATSLFYTTRGASRALFLICGEAATTTL